MTFELAVVLIVAIVAVVLGLVVYNLLGRLHVLESAVQGGLQPPSRRLSREEFERQFATATARTELAKRFDTGVVLFADSASQTARDVLATARNLPRHDYVHVVACDAQAADMLSRSPVPFVALDELATSLSVLGVSTLPFAFVVDEQTVRASRHLASSQALIDLLAEFT